MDEPSIRTSRLAIAGGLAAAIAIGTAGFFIGRTTAPQPEPDAIATPAPSPAPTALNDRVLRRTDLIALAGHAADVLSSGERGDPPIKAAAGQRFELALPFGCSGPSESGPAMRWHYDDADETLRVTVEPARWTADEWALVRDTPTEIAEGFWISRPWSSSEVCSQGGSAIPQDAEAITLPGQTLAIAQFFAEGTNRDARRDGRPYEAVKRIPAESFDGSQGLVLRVSGRIGEIPGGGLVRCVQPAGAEQRPVCVIGVRLDEVSIENPATEDVIASWQIEAAG